MADDVIITYKLVPEGGKEVEQQISKITDLTTELGTEVKAAFSGKAMEDANKKLETFNKTAGITVTKITSAKTELRALTDAISSGKLEGKALETAKNRAAELQNTIHNVRGEIQKMASDTRLFDTMVEGIRGVTAAFAVAQGVTALFGDENEDLQKALLKVQGATAILTGVQELANIATKQGGIVTQAYGLALRVVDGIQKTLAVSSTVAWGIIGVAIAAVGAAVAFLVSQLGDAENEFEKLGQSGAAKLVELEAQKIKEGNEKVNDEIQKNIEILTAQGGKKSEILKLQIQQTENTIDANKKIIDSYHVTEQKLSFVLTQIISGQESYNAKIKKARDSDNQFEQIGLKKKAEIQKEALDKVEAEYKRDLDAFKKFADEKNKLSVQQVALNQLLQVEEHQAFLKRLNISIKDGQFIIDSEAKFRKEAAVKRQKDIDSEPAVFLTPAQEAELAKLRIALELTGNDTAAALKLIAGKSLAEVQQMLANFNASLTNIQIAKALEDAARKAADEVKKQWIQALEGIKTVLGGIAQLSSNIFANELQRIDESRQEALNKLDEDTKRQIALAGDNEKQKTAILAQEAKKKEKIERDSAIAKAKIERQSAILGKVFSLLDAGINTALAVLKIQLQASVLAANPLTIALVPAALAQIPIAIAAGVLQAAAIAARPIPSIPKFKKGVLDFQGRGTETSDENLVYISNRESVMTAAATKKYPDILKAAQELKLEHYIAHKFIQPALQSVAARNAEDAVYDDVLARKELKSIKLSARENTREIVRAINEKNYLNNRYN